MALVLVGCWAAETTNGEPLRTSYAPKRLEKKAKATAEAPK